LRRSKTVHFFYFKPQENIKIESGNYLKTISFQTQHDALRLYSLWFTSAEKFWLHALKQNESTTKGNIAMFSPRKSFILLSPRKSVTAPGGLDLLKEELEEFDREEEMKYSKSMSFNQPSLNDYSPTSATGSLQRAQSVKTSSKKLPKGMTEKLKRSISESHSEDVVDSNSNPSLTPNMTPSITPNLTPTQSSAFSQTSHDVDGEEFCSPRSGGSLKKSPPIESYSISESPAGEDFEKNLSMSPDKEDDGFGKIIKMNEEEEDDPFTHIVTPMKSNGDSQKVNNSPVPKLKLGEIPDTIGKVSSPLNSDRISPTVSPMFSPTIRLLTPKMNQGLSQLKIDSKVIQDTDEVLINLQNKITILVGENEFDEAKKVIDLMKGIAEKFTKGDQKSLENLVKKAKKIE
jgi:hypothetical protein